MILYIVDEANIHEPFYMKEINYTAVPRVGEKIIAEGQLYKVSAVYHNLDLQEIKIITKKVSQGE